MSRTGILIACAAALVVIAAGVGFGIVRALNVEPGFLSPPDFGLAPESESTSRSVSMSGEASAAASGLARPNPLALVTPREFDARAAMVDVRALVAFGPRGGGSAAEADAADYLRDRLEAIGLDVRTESFPLTNGATSRNVIARVPGASPSVLVLGAHYDTKPPSPGANDNATGCAALLQIAESLKDMPAPLTVEFVFFGAEETIDDNPHHHHFGSRYRVSKMTSADRAATKGMISVDMIGFGPTLHSRTMGRAPKSLSDKLVAHAKTIDVPITYLRDPGPSGWSDHEPYELAGIPVSWIEWRDDPVYHTAADTATHVSQAKLATAGKLVLSFTRSLDAGN